MRKWSVVSQTVGSTGSCGCGGQVMHVGSRIILWFAPNDKGRMLANTFLLNTVHNLLCLPPPPSRREGRLLNRKRIAQSYDTIWSLVGGCYQSGKKVIPHSVVSGSSNDKFSFFFRQEREREGEKWEKGEKGGERERTPAEKDQAPAPDWPGRRHRAKPLR